MTAAQEVAAGDRTSDLLIQRQVSQPLGHSVPRNHMCVIMIKTFSGLFRQDYKNFHQSIYSHLLRVIHFITSRWPVGV